MGNQSFNNYHGWVHIHRIIMKKTILILVCLAAVSFQPEKKYKFEFNLNELNAIMYAIDQSNAPHATVKQVQDLITKQYQSQVDTLKKK